MKDLFSSQTIIHNDCLEKMRDMQENSIDCILTDPPYGLSFMGKHWDKGIPGKEFWFEALRVCKPGAIMLAFGGTRTYHRLACAIEDAGWQIRDSLMWLYGSGFPKSHNNFGFKGYGTALKPAYEPIIMAMKPLDGTFAQNAEKWGVGGINIDECRIAGSHSYIPRLNYNKNLNDDSWKSIGKSQKKIESKGRWPSNLLLDKEAAEMLDEQSGILKSGSIEPHHNFKMKKISAYGKYESKTGIQTKGDSGGASRFFYCAKASPSERNKGCEGMPYIEKSNGNKWTDQDYRVINGERPQSTQSGPRQNHHPTVKPTKLIEYLLKLIMPPSQNAIVLDPFMGSGSTLVAAKNLGFNAIGIEIENEYCEIARNRIS